MQINGIKKPSGSSNYILMPLNNTIFTVKISTPIGEMIGAATDKGVCLLEFKERVNLTYQLNGLRSYFKKEIIPGKNIHLLKMEDQIQKYFKKEINNFSLPLDMAGTPYQQTIWKALLKIPFGTTISYLNLSEKIGNHKAIRAVANSIAANKIAIIIPCHRVIGSDGRLTGYAGGLWRKKYLLNLEDRTENGQLSLMDIL
jgi:O-6-methylguanine DNA methyltransferase